MNTVTLICAECGEKVNTYQRNEMVPFWVCPDCEKKEREEKRKL